MTTLLHTLGLFTLADSWLLVSVAVARHQASTWWLVLAAIRLGGLCMATDFASCCVVTYLHPLRRRAVFGISMPIEQRIGFSDAWFWKNYLRHQDG